MHKYNPGIYKLTSPSGKVYIGQSHNIKARLNRYKNLSIDRQPHLYNALTKHPWSEWKVEVVVYADDQWLLDHLETQLIKLYDSTNREKGYNLSLGGARGKASDETKRKLSIARKKRITSDETRAKMSARMKGNKRSLGIATSTKQKLAVAASNRNRRINKD